MIKEKLTTLFLPYPDRLDRMVRVFVPEHEEGETFPVIYMTDGQNLFDEESSGFGCWHIREALREERQLSGRTAIVVGIHNIDPWRHNELLPAAIGEIQCPEGARPFINPQGEIFDAFVLKTMMPAVDMFGCLTIRTVTRPSTATMGIMPPFGRRIFSGSLPKNVAIHRIRLNLMTSPGMTVKKPKSSQRVALLMVTPSGVNSRTSRTRPVPNAGQAASFRKCGFLVCRCIVFGLHLETCRIDTV